MLYREISSLILRTLRKHTNTLCGQNLEFLGAFAKLRTPTISFIMSVCLSYVCPHGTTRPPLDGFS
jgi:hypothetical protein